MSSIGVTTPSPPTAALHCAAAAGAAYNTATAFEKVTTKKLSRKVLASCRIIPQGRELTVLMNYYKKETNTVWVKGSTPCAGAGLGTGHGTNWKQ